MIMAFSYTCPVQIVPASDANYIPKIATSRTHYAPAFQKYVSDRKYTASERLAELYARCKDSSGNWESASYWRGVKRQALKYVTQQARWLRMLTLIGQAPTTGNCQYLTANEIRIAMGWTKDSLGWPSNRSHCDYFSTLQHDGLISHKRIGGKIRYFLTTKGQMTKDRGWEIWKKTIAEKEAYVAKKNAALALCPQNCEELEHMLRVLEKAEKKAQIVNEAKNG